MVQQMMRCTFKVPPRHVRSFRSQKNRAKSYIEDFYTTINVPSELTVYEIWAAITEEDKELFLIITDKCFIAGNRQPEWDEKAEYCGYFDNIQAAINNITTKVN